MRRTVLVAAVLGLAAAMAETGHAQILRGRILEDGTGAPISNAHITLLIRNTQQIAAEADGDSVGRFRMLAPRPDTYDIRIDRIGYQPVAIDSFGIGEDREVVVEFRMALNAVPLEPVRVLGNSRYDHTRLEDYYDRMERMTRAGIGRFITREDVEATPTSYVSDLMRGHVPTLQVVGRQRAVYFYRNGRECMPSLYIDGVLANRNQAVGPDEFVSADLVEGIEVYRGLTQMPGEYVDLSGCGVILIWTRRGFDEGRPFSWKRMLVAGAVTSLIFLLVR